MIDLKALLKNNLRTRISTQPIDREIHAFKPHLIINLKATKAYHRQKATDPETASRSYECVKKSAEDNSEMDVRDPNGFRDEGSYLISMWAGSKENKFREESALHAKKADEFKQIQEKAEINEGRSGSGQVLERALNDNEK